LFFQCRVHLGVVGLWAGEEGTVDELADGLAGVGVDLAQSGEA
jgi:hypothetical protein